ncbi:uncharacterized protein LOC127121220 isoform X2 [Lathyrus oleraceus]|uniref:Bromo domain-containing protein n=2 Tax=Pisum sativum TaxID=3888 RepID=A0A9D4YAU3_PEA|nr:uncharacterized protein LOC127121220 isoform X2 [Pisum sativum]KAI5434823.1 hypothetical protein KIW84_021586 [Pisum sativum]
MGSKETKTIGFEDESKQNEKKRRSQENITLEDGKEELKRNKDLTNTSFDKDGNARNFSIKKIGFTCNTPSHLQMIPSVKDGQYHPQSGSTSQTNVSYAMPEKYILEFFLDVLQRSDPDELFAKPINPNGVHKPLDFATIRAKINMKHYMNMDSFKFDVYRLCFNAMYYNDKDSRHYQVAKALHSLAKSVFEDTSVLSLERFHLESLPKNTQGGIPQDGKQKTIGHARFRHTIPSGGRKKNSTITIPQFLEKNVASISKDISAGASSSQMEFWSSQNANYLRRANDANNSFSSQQNQYGYFQGLVSPSTIYSNQTNENELFKAKKFFSTFPINSYSELQMILGQACPMGPFPMLQHPISSSGPFPSSSIVMNENLKESKGDGENKEKNGEGTSINDSEVEELGLDLKL